MTDTQSRLRAIPQISAVLADERIRPLLAGRRREWVTRLVQRRIEALRARLLQGEGPVEDRERLLKEVVQDIVDKYDELLEPAWTRVLNGTGVVVHTNLGRANLPPAAVQAMAQVAAANSDLEYDLAAGARGHRGRRVEAKAALLAGAEDALIVNNNAAAVWLTVRFASRGGPVVLSRGEVVAIGGSFRMHEILAETGCRLVEIGTTNRTSLEDYRRAMTPGATVLKVHRSNFAVEGFTEDVDLPELAVACREAGCTLIYDAGSGVLHPMDELGLPAGERLLAEDVATGADLVTCSGDKLLGGCQAGIILGRHELIAGAAPASDAAGLPGRQDDPGRPGCGAERVPGGRGQAGGADDRAAGDGRGAAAAAGRGAAGAAGAPRPGPLAGPRGTRGVERRRRFVQHGGHGLAAGAVAGPQGGARGLPPAPAHGTAGPGGPHEPGRPGGRRAHAHGRGVSRGGGGLRSRLGNQRQGRSGRTIRKDRLIMANKPEIPHGLPRIEVGCAAADLVFGSGDGFWQDLDERVAGFGLDKVLDRALAGRSAPRVWVLVHEPGQPQLAAAAALGLARTLADRGQAALVIDGDDHSTALSRWAGRENDEGWIDIARYGTSVLTSGVALPFAGRAAYLLGVGSYAPTDATEQEIEHLITRLRRQADDLLVVLPGGAHAAAWARKADIRLLCHDQAVLTPARLGAVVANLADAGVAPTALLGFGHRPAAATSQEQPEVAAEPAAAGVAAALAAAEEADRTADAPGAASGRRRGTSSVFWLVAVAATVLIACVAVYYFRYVRVPDGNVFGDQPQVTRQQTPPPATADLPVTTGDEPAQPADAAADRPAAGDTLAAADASAAAADTQAAPAAALPQPQVEPPTDDRRRAGRRAGLRPGALPGARRPGRLGAAGLLVPRQHLGQRGGRAPRAPGPEGRGAHRRAAGHRPLVARLRGQLRQPQRGPGGRARAVRAPAHRLGPAHPLHRRGDRHRGSLNRRPGRPTQPSDSSGRLIA